MWAEAGLEQLCCHIPWCRSGAAGLVCIYSRGSVHSTRQFLIYRLGGAGAAPTLSQAQTSSYGGERRSQLRTGESWAKALRALRCKKHLVPDPSGPAEASLAPEESIAQPRGAGISCAQASPIASWQQSVTASSPLPCLPPPASSLHVLPAPGAAPGPLSLRAVPRDGSARGRALGVQREHP